MNTLQQTAPAFVEMAHQIVWCGVTTVDKQNRPRTRILHPLWQWDGEQLIGWVATAPSPFKRGHLEHSPYVSMNYWSPSQDTCVAECNASWGFDDETRKMVWDLFANTPEPVGYNPTIIPGWDSPTAESFAVLKLEPWYLRVFPGTMLLEQKGEVFTWQA